MRPQRELIRVYGKRIAEGNGTFEDIFDANFSQKENVLFEYEDGTESKKVTFGQTESMIRSLAAYLVKAFQGKRDMYVALNMDNSVEWVVSFWAILMSGNKPYLVNLRHPLRLTASIIRTLKIEYSLDLGKPNEFGILSVRVDEHLHDKAEDVSFEWANEIALSTSATTMQEKICLYNGKDVLAQFSNIGPILRQTNIVRKTYNGTIKLLAFLPFYHIFGLVTTYFWFTYFGYEIVLLKDYAPQTILKTIRKFGVTHVFSVPLFWHEIEKNIMQEVERRGQKEKFEKAVNFSLKLPTKLSQAFAKKAFKEVRNALFGDSVQLCIVGGSYVRPQAQRLLNAIGYPLFNGYGTTEIGITSCDFSKNLKERLRCSVGKPFAAANYEIVDGCLRVSGPSTCHAVIVNGEKKETNHVFDTLDLAEVDEYGNYHILGRKSDLIVSKNGENINPDDLENMFDLSSLPVKRFCVLGLGEKQDEVAFVMELERNLAPEELEAIRTRVYAINESLPSTSRVQSFYITNDPLQSEGAIKISRTYVRSGIERGIIKPRSFEEFFQEKSTEVGDVEAIVRSIFAKNLNLDEEKILPTSHFGYDLGGNSLSYYGVLMDINDRFGLTLNYDPENPLFTVEEFSNRIRQELGK